MVLGVVVICHIESTFTYLVKYSAQSHISSVIESTCSSFVYTLCSALLQIQRACVSLCISVEGAY